MKKTLFLLICVFTIFALVSCDSDGASSGSKNEKLTTEQIVDKIVDSEMLNSMTEGISAFCSVEPEWATDFSSSIEKHSGTNYVKRLEENATIIRTGKPYRAIVEFPVESKVLTTKNEYLDVYDLSLDDMVADQNHPETMTIVESESVEFGGIAEQSSTSTITINLAKFNELKDYCSETGELTTGLNEIMNPLLTSQDITIEQIESIFNAVVEYYENKKPELASKIDAAYSCSVVFSKVIVDGVSYDPAPIGTYLSSHFGEYMTNQVIMILRSTFETILDAFNQNLL